MTGRDWFDEIDMLEEQATERQGQLFAVACCRRVWHLMTDARHRAVVEAAERLADGELTEAAFLETAMTPIIDKWRQLPDHSRVAWKPRHFMTGATRHLGISGSAAHVADFCARGLASTAGAEASSGWATVEYAERAWQLEVTRDILGLEFRPVAFDPAWRTEHTVGLAAKMYDEREFAAMPILADALEEAGCDNHDILTHCREPGVHVRGCWVVDLVLGQGVKRPGRTLPATMG